MQWNSEISPAYAIRKIIDWKLHQIQKISWYIHDRIRKGLKWRWDRLTSTVYLESLYRIATLKRRSLSQTEFIGITGSAGKTTTKDLLGAILEHHLPRGRKGAGTMNGPEHVARFVLGTRTTDRYCVTEMALVNDDSFDQQISVYQPTVGVVTNIGGDHLSAYGGIDGVVTEKSKLIRALPPNGIAVLNADDPRVIAMRSLFAGRTITYGIDEQAMVHGAAVESSWPNRLSLTVTWLDQSVRVETQLCGSHWAPVVLAAIATAVALGVPLATAAEALTKVKPFEGRMYPVELGDGVTFIRDDWKAPFWTIKPTLEFMQQARAKRKIIVMGTLSDYTGDSSKRYSEVAKKALASANCVLFVGPRSSASLRAKRNANDQLFAFPSARDASTFLSSYLRTGDLVLLKGSTRADHLERLILARNGKVACWRSGCGRVYYCNEPEWLKQVNPAGIPRKRYRRTVCDFLHVPSEPGGATGQATYVSEHVETSSALDDSAVHNSEVVVIGLGNPEPQRFDTKYNVGFRVLDALANSQASEWIFAGDYAEVFRMILDGVSFCLVKPLAPMNDIGSAVQKIARTLDFEVSQCILVHDDLDLPLGTVRARNRGGDGGHGGVRSILQSFQDDRFRRVKVGIGKPGDSQSIVDFVLTPFPPEQLANAGAGIDLAVDRVLEIAKQMEAKKASSI